MADKLEAAKRDWESAFWAAVDLPHRKADPVGGLSPEQALMLRQAVHNLTGGGYSAALYTEMDALVESGWDSAKELLDLSASFTTLPTFALEEIQKRADEIGFLANQRDSQTVLDLIDGALSNGWTPKKLASEISNAFADGYHVYDQAGAVSRVIPTDAWSLMVARTELSRAQTMGNVALYRAAQVEKVMWATTEGDNVCPICEPADGEIQNLGDVFDSVDVDAPPAHPMCACALLPADPDIVPT